MYIMKKLIKKLWLKGDQSIWNGDVAKEKAFLASFPEPANLVERSYFQYKCHNIFYAGSRLTLWKIISFFAMPAFFLLLLLKGMKKVQPIHSQGVFMGAISMEYVRKTIEPECPQWTEISVLGEMELTGNDVKFFLSLWVKYFFSPLFLFKILIKLARYSHVIRKYSPQIIMTEEVSSFASSAMTSYCHSHNVKHYFAEHGEVLFGLRDTFAAFDRYYIWDEFYADLYRSMQFPADAEFCIVKPFGRISAPEPVEKIYDYTYYLQAETREELNKKRDNLDLLKQHGAKIAVRPHPRYTNMNDFNEIFANYDREDPKAISLDLSLLRTKNVISEYSTVLYQAYLAEINVIIDDLCAPERIEILRSRSYIMLNKKFESLSFILRSSNHDN